MVKFNFRSLRASYGDDALSYVQLKRDGKLCTVKCKICPEHKIRAKLYAVTLVVDEEDYAIRSVQCHDCVASQGGCKHAIAFLVWVHRRSEEPSCTSVECYWKKSKLSMVGTSLKYITAKALSKSSPSLPSNSGVFAKFLEEGRKRNITECELLKYQSSSCLSVTASASMHQLVFKYREESCELFLKKVAITGTIIKKIEEETREQHKSSLWFELRYGRITASKAFEVSRCKTTDGTLISVIMGGKIPDTSAMKRGRILEDGKKIKKCGLMLSQKYPMIAGSPDGICEDSIIEIKCPISTKTYGNYIKDQKPTEKYYIQMQIQMYLSGMKNCFFCVADADYNSNKKIKILNVAFSYEFVTNLIEDNLLKFWKKHVYPLLYECNK